MSTHHTIGVVADATRRVTTAPTTLKYAGLSLLALAWAAVGLDAFGAFGRPMTNQEIATLLSALIVASLLAGLAWLIRGPGFYKSLKLGEAIGEQRERRRHRCAVAPNQRVGAITG